MCVYTFLGRGWFWVPGSLSASNGRQHLRGMFEAATLIVRDIPLVGMISVTILTVSGLTLLLLVQPYIAAGPGRVRKRGRTGMHYNGPGSAESDRRSTPSGEGLGKEF
jgi:hypothetical protein